MTDRSTDDLILDAIHSAEDLDAMVVTDAFVVYAAIGHDQATTHYGAIYLGGTMPHHRILGLLEIHKDHLLNDEDDE